MTWREGVLGLRAKLGMTQEQLARELCVGISTVTRWENGHVAPLPAMRRAMRAMAEQHGVAVPQEPSEAEVLLAAGQKLSADEQTDATSIANSIGGVLLASAYGAVPDVRTAGAEPDGKTDTGERGSHGAVEEGQGQEGEGGETGGTRGS